MRTTPNRTAVATGLALVTTFALVATGHAVGATTGAPTEHPADRVTADVTTADVTTGDNTFGSGLADAVLDASSTMYGTRALVETLDDPSPWVLAHDRFPDGAPDDHALLFATDAGDVLFLGGDEVFAPMVVSIDPHDMLDVLGLTGDELFPVLDVEADCHGDAMSVLCLGVDATAGVLYAVPGVYVEEISTLPAEFMPSETEGMSDGLTSDPDAEFMPSQTEGMADGLTVDPDAEYFPSETDGMANDLAGNDNEWRALPSPALLRDVVELLWFMDQTNPESELKAMLDDALVGYVPDLDSDSSGMVRSDLAEGVVTVLRSDPDLLDLALGIGRSRLDGHLLGDYDYPDFLDIQLAPGASNATERVRAVLAIVNDAHELALVLDDWVRTPGRNFKVEIEGVTQAAWSWITAPLLQPRMFDEADALFGKRTGLRSAELADRVEQILVHLDDRDTSAGTFDDVVGRLRIAIDHVGAGLRSDDPVLAAATDPDDPDEPGPDERLEAAPDDERTTTDTTSGEPGGTTEPERPATTEPGRTTTTEPERTTTTVAERPATTEPERTTTTTVPERTTTTVAERPATTEPERTTTATEPERTTTTTTTAPDRSTTTTPSR